MRTVIIINRAGIRFKYKGFRRFEVSQISIDNFGMNTWDGARATHTITVEDIYGDVHTYKHAKYEVMLDG